MKQIVRGGVVFNAAAILLAVLLMMIDRTSLIILLGVVTADLLVKGGWVLWCVLFAAGNLLFWRRVLREKRLQTIAEARTMPIEISPREALSPARLREELGHFYKLRPALQEQITAAIAQMDSMDRKQAKLRRILERNRISSLDEVEETVRDAEQVLCRDMAKLINRIILWDPLEWNKPGKEAIYDGHRDYIRKLLNQGDEILLKCDVLLAETVSYLDEKDVGADSGKLHLDVMTQTIQSLRNIGSLEL